MFFAELLPRLESIANEGPARIPSRLERRQLASLKTSDLNAIPKVKHLHDRFREIDKRGYWFSRTNEESSSGDGSALAFLLSSMLVILATSFQRRGGKKLATQWRFVKRSPSPVNYPSNSRIG